MRTTKQKLKYILDEINSVQNHNAHVKNAKEIKIKYYKLSEKQLKDVPPSKILNHSFGGEVLRLGEQLEKTEIINKIIKTKNIKISRHRNAPEINTTIIVGAQRNEIKTPHVVEIDKNITPYQKLMHPDTCNLKTFLSRQSLVYLNNLLLLN
jgi:hypothetical protein